MRRALEPAIKWSGSKHLVAAELAAYFPRCNRFIDPFVGGGALLPVRPTRQAIASDALPELIELWRAIQRDPSGVSSRYEERWRYRMVHGASAYYEIRSRFNVSRSPDDLLFLSRTCVNGLVRFNTKGEFNNSLHYTRPGIHPDKLQAILLDWSHELAGVEFMAQDYLMTLRSCGEGDFVFLDPPYAHTRGRYRPGDFSTSQLYEELRGLNDRGVRWLMTFDGRAGNRLYEAVVPRELYKHRYEIRTGLSPFKRLMRESHDAVVESVYLNFDPPTKRLGEFQDTEPEPLPTSIA